MAYKYSSNPGPSNPGPDMADDYETSTARADKAETNEGDEGEPTALIPKALLAGKEFKVGEEVVFKIVHMYDDEVEIEYATGEEGEKDEESHPHKPIAGKTMMDTESKLDEIAK